MLIGAPMPLDKVRERQNSHCAEHIRSWQPYFNKCFSSPLDGGQGVGIEVA
jgi:hypothetical protein